MFFRYLIWHFYVSFMLLSSYAMSEEITNYTIPPKEYTLKERYIVTQSQIFSTTLFPNIPKQFLLLNFPPQQFSLKMRSYELAAIFERNGFVLHTPYSDVEFIYRSSMELRKPKEFIERMYIEYYERNCPKSFVLDSIMLRPQGDNISTINFENAEFEFFGRQNALKKANGVLIAKNNDSKIMLYYEVLAHLKVWGTTRSLKAGESVLDSIKSYEIAFKKLTSLPACEDEIEFSSAKSYIAQDTMLTKDKLRPSVLVKKGDFVVVKSAQKGFFLETRLQALQNGTFGDVIEAKASESNKIVKIKIVGKNQGVVL